MRIALFNNSVTPARPAFPDMLEEGAVLVILRPYGGDCCFECAANPGQLAVGYGWIIHESNLDIIGEL